jgi:hypothetical protein
VFERLLRFEVHVGAASPSDFFDLVHCLQSDFTGKGSLEVLFKKLAVPSFAMHE